MKARRFFAFVAGAAMLFGVGCTPDGGDEAGADAEMAKITAGMPGMPGMRGQNTYNPQQVQQAPQQYIRLGETLSNGYTLTDVTRTSATLTRNGGGKMVLRGLLPAEIYCNGKKIKT